MPLTSARACGRRLALIRIGLGDGPVFQFASKEACFHRSVCAFGPTIEPHSPCIIMATLHIILNSSPRTFVRRRLPPD